MRSCFSMVLCGLILAATALPARAELDKAVLAARLQAIASRPGLGTLGVAVRDLNSGDTVMLRGGEAMPQQSVYKLAIAVAALARAERGEFDLDERVTITADELSPMWSPIAQDMGSDGITVPASDLLRRMIALSDNTASDTVLDRLGGPAAAQAELDAKGVRHVRIDRPERQLVPNVVGLGDWQPRWRDPQALRSAIDAVPDGRARAALSAYFADSRDAATPAGLLDLLTRLDAGDLLDPSGTTRLLDWLEQTSTGTARLRAGLPDDWRLAHKTGTGPTVFGVASAVNDVGIAYAPDGGRLAIVVLIRGATAPAAEREAAIAAVAAATVAAYR